jgi:uncharacterized protein Yka (UPF0111/DUF47 family)
MTETPMDLIRKLDETAAALLDLARRVRSAAPAVADVELRREMLESADGIEQRAEKMAEAIQRWRREIN